MLNVGDTFRPNNSNRAYVIMVVKWVSESTDGNRWVFADSAGRELGFPESEVTPIA